MIDTKEVRYYGDLTNGQVALLVLHFQDPDSITQENLPFWKDVEHLFPDYEQIERFIEYAEERLEEWWTAE